MDERRSRKISLTIYLLIIELIIIVVMGIYIYTINTAEKNILDSSNNNIIDNNIIEDNNTVENNDILQDENAEKNILDSSNNSIIENNIVEDNNTVEDNIILQDEDAEKMAKKVLNEYIRLSNYENSNIGPMPNVLVELGLETYENIDLLTSGIYDALGIYDSSMYIKSNTKYEDFKEKLLQYVTEDYFLENFSQYKNIEGYVGFCNCAGGTTLGEVEETTLSSVNGTVYTFNVVLKDMEMYEHYLNSEDGESITEDDYLFNTEVCFEYVNNKLVISQW